MERFYLPVFLLFRSVLSVSNNTYANCTLNKLIFTDHVSEFTSCAIANSRPVKMCESCVDVYINVTESYDNLKKFSDDKGPCIDQLINLDRLEIVLTLYRNSNNLWNRAKCYDCFVISNGFLTHNRSQQTVVFNELYNDTMDCINKTDGKPESLCPTCMDTYLKLNDYYYDIINENEMIAGCMDIVDMMNSTRSFWSEKCCKTRRRNEVIFLVSTGCMCLISVLFYILAKMCTDMKKPAVFKQSRFSESLSRINED